MLSQDTKPDEVYSDDFEALAAPVSDESADAPEPIHEEDESIWPVSESVADAARPEPEVIQESEPEAVDNAVAEGEETRTAPVLRDSPDEDKPPLVEEEADSEIAESAQKSLNLNRKSLRSGSLRKISRKRLGNPWNPLSRKTIFSPSCGTLAASGGPARDSAGANCAKRA